VIYDAKEVFSGLHTPFVKDPEVINKKQLDFYMFHAYVAQYQNMFLGDSFSFFYIENENVHAWMSR